VTDNPKVYRLINATLYEIIYLLNRDE